MYALLGVFTQLCVRKNDHVQIYVVKVQLLNCIIIQFLFIYFIEITMATSTHHYSFNVYQYPENSSMHYGRHIFSVLVGICNLLNLTIMYCTIHIAITTANTLLCDGRFEPFLYMIMQVKYLLGILRHSLQNFEKILKKRFLVAVFFISRSRTHYIIMTITRF